MAYYFALFSALTHCHAAAAPCQVPPDEEMEADAAAAAVAPMYRGNGGRNAPAHYLPVAALHASSIGARRDAYAEDGGEMYGGSLGGSRVIRTGGYDPSSTPQRMAERLENMRIAAAMGASLAADGGGDDDEREWAAPAAAPGTTVARASYDDSAEPEEQVV